MQNNQLKFFYDTSNTPIATIGVDEAGRGPLAGPVVAASVYFDKELNIKINDSKKLSPKQREISASQIMENYHYGIGIVHNDRIDEINILNATFEAMKEAIAKNPASPEQYILIDGNLNPLDFQINSQTVVKGDQKYLSIAAASIVAKYNRDKIMSEYHGKYPEYEWDQNKGYGTKRHIELIKKFGPCKYHRKSFLTKIMSS